MITNRSISCERPDASAKPAELLAEFGLKPGPNVSDKLIFAMAAELKKLRQRVAELEHAQRSPVRRFFDRVGEVVR